MLSQAILDPGDEIVCGWPSFPSYVIYARKQGAVPRTVAARRPPLRPRRAARRRVTPRTKLVYICHPNNPTGTMNTADELDAYFERVPEHVLTVVDQAYFEYIDRPDYPDAVERYLKAGRRVVVLRTFSKIYGLAGLRVGYAVAPRERLRRDGEGAPPVRHHDHRRRSLRSRASASDAELARRRAVNAEGLARLEAILREHGLEPGAVGRQLPLRRHRRRRERALRAAAARGSDRPAARRVRRRRRAIRVSVGTPDELDFFAVALGRVLAAGLIACLRRRRRSAARSSCSRRAASFRLLFLATLGSGVGTWMATIALTADVTDRTHSPWWVSALFIVTFLPSVIVGLVAGPLVDRLSRKRLIVASDLVRHRRLRRAAVRRQRARDHRARGASRASRTRSSAPPCSPGVPNLIAEEDLAHGTSLLQATDWAAATLGPILGGVIVSASGPDLVYWMNAATFLFSALLLLRIPARLLQSEQAITRGHWRDLADGLGAFRRSAALLDRARRVRLRDARDRADQRLGDLPRRARAAPRRVRLRPALDRDRRRARRRQPGQRRAARDARTDRHLPARVPAAGRRASSARRSRRTSGSPRSRWWSPASATG